MNKMPAGRHRCHCGRMCLNPNLTSGKKATPLWDLIRTCLQEVGGPVKNREIYDYVMERHEIIDESNIALSIRRAMQRGEPIVRVSHGWYEWQGEGDA